jgi:4-alpha-glucanotransferase
MKLKFSIHYHTAWGESLHICLDFHRQDGTVRRQHLMMQTSDGELWTLETAAMVSRQHPVSHIVYHYQVENERGDVLRQEWQLVPRIYFFDASQDYVFPDQWRERPLPFHLYSNAYLTTVHGRRDEVVEALRLPLFRRTVIFRVSAPQVKPGHSVAICGSHPALGSWNVSRYLQMQYAGQHEWMLSVNAMGWLLPIEYKYVIVDDETHAVVCWEEGDNRVITAEGWTSDNTYNPLIETNNHHLSPTTHHLSLTTQPPTSNTQLAEGQVLVLYGDGLRVCEEQWRAAGVCVPVFSLRSEHSYGVGDFGDLRRFVDWAVATGMKVIQLLPVNDTTRFHHWGDSCPYNVSSAFALHPHYVDLEAAGTLRSKEKMTQFLRRRQELNALSESDYEAVDRVKTEYLKQLFAEQGKRVLESTEGKAFVHDNEEWLKPYAEYYAKSFGAGLGDSKSPSLGEGSGVGYPYVCFVQFLLHTQLKEAADYARSKGIVLKGDLPIGLCRQSVEVRQHPEFFHLDSQTGAPPDSFSKQGQNWEFPTYQWSEDLLQMQRQRLAHMAQYFDAVRLDHVLGYFRIWEIPSDAVYGVMGHYSPSLPLTIDEIEYFGLPFRKGFFTRPFINDKLIDRLFGIHAQYVRENYLQPTAYHLYDLVDEVSTQRKVAEVFSGRTDENSLWIREGLMRLISNVLFVEDPRQPEMYHPRIDVINEPVFEALSADEKDAFRRLYDNYFTVRHHDFWRQQALHRLAAVMRGSRMLFCAEDLGLQPDCVAPVLDELRILTLEIQQLPKHYGFEYTHLEAMPIRSVCTITTHDMAPLRLWWEENPERRQRYYVSMLQKEGRAPVQLPPHLAEEIIARHLYCPSMFCILQLQDWLSMDSELRSNRPQMERINTPSDVHNRWQYRMHLTIEQLLEASRYNNKVKTMISRSKR